jgi:2-polyprenyl-6-methoxyphenol hydroxylase-like FAD-dependent oxidoreductase
MLLKNKQIAIVGGGPGGLTLARLLQLQNIQVKVYERDQDRSARVQGSTLDLHESSGLAALKKAGLLDEFKKNYLPNADRTTITNDKAEVVFSDHDIEKEIEFGHEHFRPEIDRGSLRKILIDSLQENTIVWDSQFISMQKQGDGWLLHFKDRKSAYADLVIGSDGANSKIRPYITDIKPFYSGITMLEGNVYNAKKVVPGISEILNGGKIMAFGINKNILIGQKGNGEIGFYASFKVRETWALESGLDFTNNLILLDWFKKDYAEWSSVWNELFENASTPFIPRPIYCMPLDQNWAALTNATIIGDAAHVMPPFAGEGVNMAMLDALELSECFAANHYGSILEMISDFEMNMLKRASGIAKESLDNGEKMHSEDALTTMTDFFRGHT